MKEKLQKAEKICRTVKEADLTPKISEVSGEAAELLKELGELVDSGQKLQERVDVLVTGEKEIRE